MTAIRSQINVYWGEQLDKHVTGLAVNYGISNAYVLEIP